MQVVSSSRSPSTQTHVLCNFFSPPSKRCFHPTIYNRVCVYCVKTMEDGYGVCFDYVLKGLRFSSEEVIRLKQINSDIVFRQKKLHLVLDLDHTLLHAVHFDKLSSDVREHLMRRSNCLDGDVLKISAGFLVKLRPYVRNFLKEASSMYDISICTMGTRTYAQQIAKFLDPKCEYFISSRLITREDFNQREKKSLDLVLGQERNIVIVDDTEEVWSDHKENLILVGRYNYFKREIRKKRICYSEREKDESEMNGALANVLRTLKTIHGLYSFNNYHQDSGIGDVRILLGNIRRHILSGCTLLFSDDVDVEKFPLLQWRAEELGAACTAMHDSRVTHVVSEQQVTKDCLWAEQQKKYFVHPRWIYAAYYLWTRQPEKDYVPL